jgi:DNA-binding transcriptional LysR family regulator/uncharacterized membrane protein (DUF2068 family)
VSRMTSPKDPPIGIRLIVAYKLVRGFVALLIALALGSASLWGGEAVLRDLADRLLAHFTQAWAIDLAHLLVRGSSTRALHIGTVAFAVDGLFVWFEAWTLRRQFRWSRWLVVAATASLLPFETYHLYRGFHAGRLILLLANLAVDGKLFGVKLSGIDANLLAALDALLREKSVTRAAKRLGVGQPALSHSLARLRDHFKDELLVLKGRNYVLTDKAEKMASVVANATRALVEVFEEQPSFDAATSSHSFVVACSDLFGILIIPELLRTLKREAEQVEVELRAIAGASIESILEGGVDLALGIFEDVPASINQQSLYDDPAVCVVRANHEQVGKRLTLEAYARLPHLEIGTTADSIPALHIDRALAAIGKRRHVTLRVPYYLLAPHILEQTDHVATVSTSGAEILVKLARLRVVDPPIELPSYKFSQIWQNSDNDSRAHTWLRERIASICEHRRIALTQ